MTRVSHLIAGLTCRTDADVSLSYLQADPFGYFEADSADPDVTCRIRQLDPRSVALPPLNETERECVLRTVGFMPGLLDRPLLCAPELRARLRISLDNPE